MFKKNIVHSRGFTPAFLGQNQLASSCALFSESMRLQTPRQHTLSILGLCCLLHFLMLLLPFGVYHLDEECPEAPEKEIGGGGRECPHSPVSNCGLFLLFSILPSCCYFYDLWGFFIRMSPSSYGLANIILNSFRVMPYCFRPPCLPRPVQPS